METCKQCIYWIEYENVCWSLESFLYGETVFGSDAACSCFEDANRKEDS